MKEGMRCLLIPLLLGSIVFGSLPITVGAASGSSTAKYLCLIVLDAGRPDYITKNIKSLPNVQKLMKAGRWYNRAWVGDLMSITPPGPPLDRLNHPS